MFPWLTTGVSDNGFRDAVLLCYQHPIIGHKVWVALMHNEFCQCRAPFEGASTYKFNARAY